MSGSGSKMLVAPDCEPHTGRRESIGLSRCAPGIHLRLTHLISLRVMSVYRPYQSWRGSPAPFGRVSPCRLVSPDRLCVYCPAKASALCWTYTPHEHRTFARAGTDHFGRSDSHPGGEPARL